MRRREEQRRELDRTKEFVAELFSAYEKYARSSGFDFEPLHEGPRATIRVGSLSGIAGGADTILVPEYPVDLEVVSEHIRRRHQGGPKNKIPRTWRGSLRIASV